MNKLKGKNGIEEPQWRLPSGQENSRSGRESSIKLKGKTGIEEPQLRLPSGQDSVNKLKGKTGIEELQWAHGGAHSAVGAAVVVHLSDDVDVATLTRADEPSYSLAIRW